jgi:ABC-2 type transport system permease protein
MSNNQPVAANKVPSSIAQVGVTMKYTLLDYLRSRRFVIMLAIVLIISALLTVLVAYYRPGSIVGSSATSLDFYSTWWGTFASFLTVISGIFFGGDGIAAEFQNKTGYFTVPNPIRRSSIYIGKFLASFTAATVVILVYLAIAVVNGLFYFGANIPYQFGESFLFAWFYLLAVLGFTFMFSSLFKTSSYAILVSFLLLIVGFSLISALIEGLTNTEPWYILSYGASIIMNVFTSPYPTTATARGFTTYVASIPEGLEIMAAYFIISSVLGLVLFQRKEFN